MRKAKYRLCVIADWQNLQIMHGSEMSKRHCERQICKEAAETLNKEPDTLWENAEITYCETGKVNPTELETYDFVFRLEGEVSPYMSRLMDMTHDIRPVEVEGSDGGTELRPFGLYKEYLRRLCNFIAELARALNRAEEMTQIYENAVSGFDLELAETSPGRNGNTYDALGSSISSLDDEMIGVLGKTWELLAIQLKTLMLLPPEMQESVLGRTLIYEKDKLEDMTDEFLTALTGIDQIQEGREYDFVMDSFVSIYTGENQDGQVFLQDTGERRQIQEENEPGRRPGHLRIHFGSDGRGRPR